MRKSTFIIRGCVIWLCAFVLCPSPAAAFRADQYAFRVSPASDQLLQQTVSKIFQDSDDFLWLLTQEGLHRYDGFSVISFRASRAASGSISHQLTTDIAEADDESLWVSTLGGGLNRLDRRNLSFTALRASAAVSDANPLSDYISTLTLSSSGNLWVGYADGSGFSEYDPRGGTFRHYFLGRNQPNASVEAFVETDAGDLYVAVAGAGVFVLSSDRASIELFEPNTASGGLLRIQDPTDLLQLSDGRLLITTYQNGAFVFDPSTQLALRHPLSQNDGSVSLEIYAAFEDSFSNHWFGTSGGIAIAAADGGITWLTSFSTAIPNDQVLDIYESRSGMIWIGTFNGLAEATPTLFQVFNESDGLPNNNVNSITVRNNTEWWIGTERGVTILNMDHVSPREWQVIGVESTLLSDYTIMSLAHDEKYVWAGSLRSGLFRIDTADLSVIRYVNKITAPNSITDNGITSILPYDPNTIYVGTYGGGLNILDVRAQTFSNFKRNPENDNSLSDDRVIAIESDMDGAVWIGTQTGLNRFDPQTTTFERFSFDAADASTISSPVILSIVEDQQRNLWVGTRSGGLNVWRSTNRDLEYPFFEQFDIGGELPSADIYGVVEGARGELWATHNAGLSKIDLKTDEVINFDESNGLQGREFNHGAAYRASPNNLMFGGPFGFNTVDPSLTFEDNFDPELKLIAIKQLNKQIFFNEPYANLDQITLGNDYQFLSIEFASLDFRRPETTRYRYRISGLQDEWINLGNTRQVTLSGVPHGEYQLRIQGTNASGRWSSNEVGLQIFIQPPIWLTWYAYSGYATIAIFLALLVWRRQHQKAAIELLRRKELEDRVAERTADLQEARTEAEQAAKAKSDFLAAMSHEIRTPMHGMLGMTELLLQSDLSHQQSRLATAAKSSGLALLELVDSILDYSRAEANKLDLHNELFSPVNLVDEICYLLSERARENHTIVAPIWLQAQYKNVEGDAGKVRQILINLVGNAIKFTRDGEVAVRCSVKDTDNGASDAACFTIDVEDSGIGISPDKLDTIFDVFTQADASTTRKYGGTGLGLAISRELAELMGGHISVRSKVGQGSTFRVAIPVTVDQSTAIQPADPKSRVVCVGPRDLLLRSFSSKAALEGLDVEVIENIASSDVSNTSDPVVLHHSIANGRVEGSSRKVAITAVLYPYLPRERSNKVIQIAPPFASDQIHSINKKPAEKVSQHKADEIGARSDHPHLTEDDSDSISTDINALVVEDVQLNQQIACSMLEPLCKGVDVVSNGVEAVEAVKAKRYDIIFMDCQMPIMDGFAATQSIRAHENASGCPRALIVALTAAAEDRDRELAEQAGMDAFIRKPFTREDLLDVIENLSTSARGKNTDLSNIEQHSSHNSGRTNDSTPILDQVVFDSLRSLDCSAGNSLLLRLRDGFIEQLDEKLVALENQSWDEQASELAKLAHSIKSMSANIGALRIRGLAEAIEKSPGEWNDEKIGDVVKTIRHLNEEFIFALDARLDT